MAGLEKRITARFFRSDRGVEPVRNWLLDLDPIDRRTIGKDIQKVEFGWPIGMPYSKPIGQGLYEVRSTLSSGRIARIFFSIEGERMVLLHAFIKKTRSIPVHELDIARKRQKGLEP